MNDERKVSVRNNQVIISRGGLDAADYTAGVHSQKRLAALLEGKSTYRVISHGTGIWFIFNLPKVGVRATTLDGDVVAARMRMIQERNTPPAGSYLTEPMTARKF